MTIPGLWQISSFDQYSLYKRGVNSRDDNASFTLKAGDKPAGDHSDPAKIAAIPVVADKSVKNASTANTLWQTQNYAQSEDSNAIDVDEQPAVHKKTAAEEFLEHMSKTPEELLREEVLRSLGYTEESLAAMDPKERAKAEAKIKEAIETKIEEAMREKGLNIDSAKSLSLETV